MSNIVEPVPPGAQAIERLLQSYARTGSHSAAIPIVRGECRGVLGLMTKPRRRDFGSKELDDIIGMTAGALVDKAEVDPDALEVLTAALLCRNSFREGEMPLVLIAADVDRDDYVVDFQPGSVPRS